MGVVYAEEFRDIKLHESISIPSKVHVYSLGVEYMRNWFLKKFDDDYFKTIYMNGKHIFDDFRRFNREQITKIEKPALAIVPTVDYEYNRDTVDLRLGGLDVLTRRSRFKQMPIIQDPDHNVFLNMTMELVKINFTFKVRVGTKAQQDDLYNFMKFAYRVGATQKEFVSYDYHLPYEAMLNMAARSGFEIIYPSEENKDRIHPRVRNIAGFLSYLNSYSMYPISYKLRTINGNCEFFMRVPDQCTHISNIDPLSRDDGEREEMLDNNFQLEMTPILSIPCPQQYYFYSEDVLDERHKFKSDIAGLYSYRTVSPPERDEHGWRRYLITEYMDEAGEVDEIDLTDLLDGSELYKVILQLRDRLFISPSIFINVKLFNYYYEKKIKMDWEKMSIVIDEPKMRSEFSQIGVYVDLDFMNSHLKIMEGVDKTRMKVDEPLESTSKIPTTSK